ncbi:hypothetical protein MAR_001139 [Mya arenaria]|uniref:Uncharacterized protein n=1 Tax=Mya arenaria TaxID=6604 RepID=A0ABY7FJ73_MYAAR|nr:uncharacterized protein LOC128207509 [Mya arenaria]WAR19301.1 hypothetical protein MAR_001139 [Mya arenaria]
MEFKILYVVLLLVLGLEGTDLAVSGIQSVADCPERGYDDHGYWTVSDKDLSRRCLLKCYPGYEPDACHVLRRQGDRWNTEKMPHCVKIPWVRWSTLVKIGAGVAAGAGAVVAAPVVLGAAGFTSAGVAAGSIAAGLQGAQVAAGSAFALAQSAGAAGITAGTNAAIGSTVGSAVATAASYFWGEACEPE